MYELTLRHATRDTRGLDGFFTDTRLINTLLAYGRHGWELKQDEALKDVQKEGEDYLRHLLTRWERPTRPPVQDMTTLVKTLHHLRLSF